MTKARKIWFSALSLLLFFGSMEALSRVVWWKLEQRVMASGERRLRNDDLNFMKVPHPVYGYSVKPGFRSPYITINSAGFHQPDEIPVERRTNQLRILCLGESTTFGTGLEWSYPTFLRDILARHGAGHSGYEVINAGVPGWTSDQIMLRVKHQLAVYRPDVAILYVGWNDFQAYTPFAAPPAVTHFEREYSGRYWKHQATARLKSVALLSAWYHRGGADDRGVAATDRNTPETRYRFLKENIADIIETLRAHQPGIRILVSTLVGRWPLGTPEQWKEIATVGWMTNAGVSPAEAPAYVDALNAQLRSVAAAARVELLDLAAEFGPLDRAQLQWDWAHMHADGYELMAWSMFSALVDRGIVRTDGPTPRASELRAHYARNARVPDTN